MSTRVPEVASKTQIFLPETTESEFLEKFAQLDPETEKVDLSKCRNLSEKCLRLLSNLPALTDLNLSECPMVSPAIVEQLIASLPRLITLRLENCPKLDEVSVPAVEGFFRRDKMNTLERLFLPFWEEFVKTKRGIFGVQRSERYTTPPYIRLEPPLKHPEWDRVFASDPIEQRICNQSARAISALISDENHFFSGDGDGTIREWNSQGGVVQELEVDGGAVSSLAKRGQRLFSGSSDGSARIYKSTRDFLLLRGPSTAISSIAVLSGGKIALGSCSIQIWDLVNYVSQTVFEGHEGAIRELIEVDGGRLISVSEDIRVWSIANGDCIATLRGHEGEVYACKNIDNKYVATGAEDGKIKFWDLNNYSLQDTLNAHAHAITALEYLGDDLIASASSDWSVCIWDWKKRELKVEIDCPSIPLRLTKVMQHTLVAGLQDGSVILWNFRSAKRIL